MLKKNCRDHNGNGTGGNCWFAGICVGALGAPAGEWAVVGATGSN